jgi:hypothetical protein
VLPLGHAWQRSQHARLVTGKRTNDDKMEARV